MITTEIPKRIIDKITANEMKLYRCVTIGTVRRYSYFAYEGGKLWLEVVAVKWFKKGKQYCKTPDELEKYAIFIRKVASFEVETGDADIAAGCYYSMYGFYFEWDIEQEMFKSVESGAVIAVPPDGAQPAVRLAECQYRGLYKNTYPIDYDVLKTIPEYRYCGYDNTHSYDLDILEYLRAYRKNPQIELLSRCVGSYLATCKSVVKKAENDRDFLQFLKANSDSIKTAQPSATQVMRAYKKKIGIMQAVIELRILGSLPQNVKRYVKQYNDTEGVYKRVIAYIDENDVNMRSYDDYLNALYELKIDTKDSKNTFPDDWEYWHTVRIGQYATEQARRVEDGYKKLNSQIAAVAEKYGGISYQNGGFMVVLAESKQQLIVEGKLLHHCVGSMDYDQRIARETSLIAFIRRVNEPTVPFVTVELSLKDNAVKQCYGNHDSRPSEDVRQFVYEVWQPYANKKIKELKKEG